MPSGSMSLKQFLFPAQMENRRRGSLHHAFFRACGRTSVDAFIAHKEQSNRSGACMTSDGGSDTNDLDLAL